MSNKIHRRRQRELRAHNISAKVRPTRTRLMGHDYLRLFLSGSEMIPICHKSRIDLHVPTVFCWDTADPEGRMADCRLHRMHCRYERHLFAAPTLNVV
jgi:hypothetical protein